MECSVPIFFIILLLWVFEVQLLMQIIVNRIAVIHEDRKKIRMVRYGSLVLIGLVEVAVFCIWIPGHLGMHP